MKRPTIFIKSTFMMAVTFCLLFCFFISVNSSSADTFDEKQWARDGRHLRRLLPLSANIRESLKAFGDEHSDSIVMSGAESHYIEGILVDYGRVRSLLLNIENRWRLVAESLEKDSALVEGSLSQRLLANTLSLAAATVSLENSRLLIESLDATIFEDRANRPLRFRGEVYVRDLYADVDYQINSRKRKKALASRLHFIEDNNSLFRKVSPELSDTISILVGIIDSSGKLDAIGDEGSLHIVGGGVMARMKRAGYSLSKAFKKSFEFVVSIFSLPTVHIKVRKPYIRDSKLVEVEKELHELCEPCDIFLHKTAYQANDWIIPGYFSHSGIWLGRESDQEALGLFDRDSNHFSYQTAKKNEDHLRTHPVFEGLFGGILSTTLQTYMLPCDTIAVLRFKEGYAHDKSDIACKAVSHLGQKYDFGFDINNIDTIVCSELIYQCYPSTIKWPVTKALGRYTFSPDEIGSMGRADGDFPFEVIYFHDGERSYKGAAAQDAYRRIVEPKLKFGEPQN